MQEHIQYCYSRPYTFVRYLKFTLSTTEDVGDISIYFWHGGYFRLPVAFEITVFEIAVVDSPRFTVEMKQI